jgi:hypothetical protein
MKRYLFLSLLIIANNYGADKKPPITMSTLQPDPNTGLMPAAPAIAYLRATAHQTHPKPQTQDAAVGTETLSKDASVETEISRSSSSVSSYWDEKGCHLYSNPLYNGDLSFRLTRENINDPNKLLELILFCTNKDKLSKLPTEKKLFLRSNLLPETIDIMMKTINIYELKKLSDDLAITPSQEVLDDHFIKNIDNPTGLLTLRIDHHALPSNMPMLKIFNVALYNLYKTNPELQDSDALADLNKIKTDRWDNIITTFRRPNNEDLQCLFMKCIGQINLLHFLTKHYGAPQEDKRIGSMVEAVFAANIHSPARIKLLENFLPKPKQTTKS